jgi:hypothetical protein
MKLGKSDRAVVRRILKISSGSGPGRTWDRGVPAGMKQFVPAVFFVSMPGAAFAIAFKLKRSLMCGGLAI